MAADLLYKATTHRPTARQPEVVGQLWDCLHEKHNWAECNNRRFSILEVRANRKNGVAETYFIDVEVVGLNTPRKTERYTYPLSHRELLECSARLARV